MESKGSDAAGMVPSLDIVIVNWNTGKQLQACVDSIRSADRSQLALHRLIVVDNASRDGSAQGLNGEGLPLRVIVNERNRGFASACNEGAAGSRADYLLFLNPDTELFTDSLRIPIQHMERPDSADVGICGVRLVDKSGAAAVSAARFPTAGILVAHAAGLSRIWPSVFRPHLLSGSACLETRDVDQIIGAFFLVRRTLFERLGGFDERFFVYFEEVDLSKRARQLGFRSRLLAEASACHHGGLSSEQVRAERLFYSVRSRLRYAAKHFSAPERWSVVAVTLFVEPFVRSAAAAARLSGREIVETLSAYGMLARDWIAKDNGTGRRARFRTRNDVGR